MSLKYNKKLPISKNISLENDNGWGKKTFYECMACVRPTIGAKFLVFAFFMAFGFLKCVMIISFALPIGLYKSLWNSGNG